MSSPNRIVVFLLVFVGLVLLIGATVVADGTVHMSGGNWLLPGGLAALALAWLVSLFP